MPIPKITAIIPSINSTTPMVVLARIPIIPAIKSPIPRNSTEIPRSKLKGSIPKRGNAIIIKPRIIKINPLVFVCIHLPHSLS